jgi:hypothetical protein
VPDPQQDAGPPTRVATSRPSPPWPVVVAGLLGLTATAVWLVGTYFFWYYEPAMPAVGSLVFGIAIVLAWRGSRVARIVATIAGVVESVMYGPGGLVAAALCLVSLVMLYMPRSNVYFRRRSEVPRVGWRLPPGQAGRS